MIQLLIFSAAVTQQEKLPKNLKCHWLSIDNDDKIKFTIDKNFRRWYTYSYMEKKKIYFFVEIVDFKESEEISYGFCKG